MKKLAAIFLCALLLNACANMRLESALDNRSSQEKKLETAVKLQNEGKISSAVEVLKALCAERGVRGVTDEALFRLSMLYLGNGMENDKEFIQHAQHNIDRLRKEYPSSSWTGMAEPVADLLANAAELRRQYQNLKKENQALSRENQALSKESQGLTKENQDLKESIEKLKRLDLEMEQKRK